MKYHNVKIIKNVLLVSLLLFTGCSKTKNETIKENIPDKQTTEIATVTDIKTVDKEIGSSLKMIDLNYDDYDLKAKDNDLELINYYQENYLFAIYDTNAMSQTLPTIGVIFKNEDKESYITDIHIGHGIIKDKNTFYYFGKLKENNIDLYKYSVEENDNELIQTFQIKNSFDSPFFFRDNLGNIYFVHINNNTESFDIYKEENGNFNKLTSIISTKQDVIYFSPELIRIIDNTLYYTKGFKEYKQVISFDLNKEKEDVIYQFNDTKSSLVSFYIKGNTLILSTSYNHYSYENGLDTVSALHLVKNNKEGQILFRDIEFYNNLHILENDILLYASHGSKGLLMNIYNLNKNIREVLQINNKDIKDVFLVYDQKVIIGFYKQQRYYQMDIKDLN